MKDLFDKVIYEDIYNYLQINFPLKLEFPLLKPSLKLTQNITFESLESSFYKDVFFAYFPLVIAKEDDIENILPPRFFKMNGKAKYLLTQTNEIPKKEYSPYIDYLKTLTFKGILKQKNDKEVFLEIDDSFIKFITSSLKNKKIKKFQDFNIDVISKEEFEKSDIFKILEIDESFDFKIIDVFSMNLEENEKYEKVYFLEIMSKELEELRYKYHLFPKRNGYNFYIKLAIQKQFKLRKSFPLSKINISFIAA